MIKSLSNGNALQQKQKDLFVVTLYYMAKETKL